MLDEHDVLEVKQISGDNVGKSVYETICAMSNEHEMGGGTILLGVMREVALFPLYKAVGVRDPEKISSDIGSACRILFNQPISPKIITEKVDGKPIIRIDIEEVDKNRKPIFIKKNGIEHGAFRRIASSDVKCTTEDLEALFQQKANQTYDTSVVPDATWDDIDPEAIAMYRRLRSELNPNAIELQWDDQELVQGLRGLVSENAVLRPTLAGIISFGKASALRRLFPSHRVDYIRVPGQKWASGSDLKLDALDMRGPIVKLIPRVIAAVLDDLPKSLVIGTSASGTRREVHSVPERVIREAVVNSLMHRSYAVNETVQVIRYSNRIEITNPGHSLKPEERFDEAGSIHRNPFIAAILHETLYAETKGSGIGVMRRLMEENGLAPPSFESDRDRDTFTGRFLFHHFLDEEDHRWLSNFSGHGLTPEKMKALIFVREVGAIDNQAYRNLGKVDALSATQHLRDLHDKELLEKRGQGRRTHYVGGPKFPPFQTIPANMDADGVNMDGSIHASNSPSSFGDRRTIETQSVPERLRIKVKTAQLTQRSNPQQTILLIEELCSWRALSAYQISHLLGIKPSYLSQRYLSHMVSEGKLLFTHPEMPRHPDQKYRKEKRRR